MFLSQSVANPSGNPHGSSMTRSFARPEQGTGQASGMKLMRASTLECLQVGWRRERVGACSATRSTTHARTAQCRATPGNTRWYQDHPQAVRQVRCWAGHPRSATSIIDLMVTAGGHQIAHIDTCEARVEEATQCQGADRTGGPSA